MITKTWLAGVLGVLLGVGIAYAPSFQVASSASTLNFPMQPIEVQRKIIQPVSPARSDSQLVLISLLAGLVVAAPIFLVAKKRT
jgi:hypothetical protein